MATTTTPKDHFIILYFAGAASYTAKTQEHLSAPLALPDLFPLLERLYPGITRAVLSSCAVTVNLDYVDHQPDGSAESAQMSMIEAGDEVAIIPPVSSG